MAPAAGAAVGDIAWPPRTVVVSVRRGGQMMTPTGETVLQPGDEVVVLTAMDASDDVHSLVAGADKERD